MADCAGTFPVWSRNGHELYWQGPPPGFNLMVATYSTNGDVFVPDKPRVWYDQRRPGQINRQDFDLAPDGKRMIAVLDPRQTETNSPDASSNAPASTHINFLLNFFDEIIRRAPVGTR
jgi:hypothetical protein